MTTTMNGRRAPVTGVAAGLLFGLALSAPGLASAQELTLDAEQPTVEGEVSGPATPNDTPVPKASVADSDAGVYIVQLDAPSMATYKGGIRGYKATSRLATGERRLNTKSKAAKKYQNYLKSQQDAFVADCNASLGRSLNVKHSYQHVLNGMAIELTPQEAESIASMPGVKRVSRERMEVPLTDAGPVWIDAPAIWSGPPNNVPHSRGEGVVIGVLDTGINSDHPSFADIGGDGYDHDNPLGSGNYVPGSYCDTTDPSFCNDKLIGAWSFVLGDPNFPAPEASDGHGVHTAGTAGGNVVNGATIVAPTTSFIRDVSGVAPHANIIAYDVCVTSCPGSALIAAVNQVVIDSGNLPNGIAAINYSISGGSDPYNDVVELGFLAATEAGIFVSASAGNSGPTAGTVAHLSPWVATVAASTHNRTIVNNLIDLDSSGGSTPDLSGLGLTSGYGPATIVYAGDFPADNGSTPELCGDGGLGDFISPWNPGTFNGEIVACDRGTFGRVEKGANVLAAGAGGYVLMDNGGGVVGDAHVLPGIHVSQADGTTLKAWLAANTGTTVATITGFNLDLSDANGDIMAGFSSRGPGSAFDVLKPDVATPGVSIMAAFADPAGCTDSCGTVDNSFGFLSGTSMAAPHTAGAAALLAAVRPDWSPHEVKSALMMTSTNASMLKEDGMTPADPFDTGAGRVDLSLAQEAGLVLDETTANFEAADPNAGGDPKTLNVPSMQDGNCVEECSWSRTLTNHEKHTIHVDTSFSGPTGLDVTVDPASLKVKSGQSGTITVTANSATAPSGWQFGQVDLARRGDGPDLHMPVAVLPSNSTDATLFNKSVSQSTAVSGDMMTYTIDITNGPIVGTIDLTDTVPDGTTFVSGSETETVTNGTTSSPFSYNSSNNELTWSGTLDVGSFGVSPSSAPLGYFSLPGIGVMPFGCPSNCDDGGFILNVPTFTFNGATYNQVIWSVNGTLEAGTASGLAASASNQELPDPAPPNNLMAPLWTDLNMGADGDGAEW
ncbi:MAG: S8 family serine peptidase, partial [Gammaproteobacteria bacterium]|nr:S8 family serine peptidase [Gammaproteobacteria bacterium]